VPAPFSIAQQAADCRALLRGLGNDRAHVVGHSSGGVIALQLALAAPEVVHSLVLLEPALMEVPSGGCSWRRSGRPSRCTRQGTKRVGAAARVPAAGPTVRARGLKPSRVTIHSLLMSDEANDGGSLVPRERHGGRTIV
jgi:pimeloyl-ACP methyl ester carboxylesterase